MGHRETVPNDGRIKDMTSSNRDDLKRQVLALASRGHSIREISDKTGISKSTVGRWTQGVLPATPAPPEVSAPHPGEATDLTTISGLEAEQTRLYAALSEQGFDRGKVVQLSYVGKALAVLRESGCADHWASEDMGRVYASLNGLWLRQLEIASRDLAQLGRADAVRILDRAIEKVRVEAAVLQ